jgi:hypothetical protein
MKMGRRFGIEIEHANSRGHHELATALATAGLTVDHNATGNYHSHGYAGWQVKYDTTIRTHADYHHKVELVSPPLTSGRDEEQVKTALAVVAPTGRVNRSCGFHVHVEARDLNDVQLRRLEASFARWQEVLMSYVSASRRRNRYCAPISSRRDRYSALNLVPFATKGTVEFRLHQGTLNANKILAFVKLCIYMVELAITDKPLFSEKIAAKTNDGNTITKNYKGVEYIIRRVSGGYKYDGSEKVFDTLSGVATEIRLAAGGKGSVSAGNFFKRKTMVNAMEMLCQEIALDDETTSFLSHHYERQINVHGYFGDRRNE